MVMKRLDIRIFHGKIDVYPKVGDMIVSYKDNIAYITTGSWYIEVRRTATIIKCSSKAMVKRRNFQIRTIQGSLFLYNSTGTGISGRRNYNTSWICFRLIGWFI